jgi:plastocyanin
MRRRTLPCAATGMALLCASAAGCGSDEDAAKPARPAANVKGDTNVNIASFKYMPERLRVRAGSEVTWVNQDKAPHTAETEGGRQSGFDTGRLDLGEKRAVTLDKPGKFEYFCVYHRFMTGTVEVVK